MESRFEELKQSPVFKNMASLFETQTWPTEDINGCGDKEIIMMTNHFRDLLSKNDCSLNVSFLNIETKKECCNLFHMFELLLFIPFTNAKLEIMFSRMLRAKTDRRK